MINSKKQLAMALSRLKTFEKPIMKAEQYSTDSEIAAEVLWWAFQNKDIKGKTIADLGCGTGILGLGALLLEAKKIYFVDNDNEALAIAENNLNLIIEYHEPLHDFKTDVIYDDVKNFDKKADVVIQNPPFGTKIKHSDKVFLEKAFKTADVVYSFHKATSKSFIEAISKDNGFKITHYFEFNWPLKQTMKFHTKRIEKIRVGCWRFNKA